MRIYFKWFPRYLWQQIFLILLGLMIIPLIILGYSLIINSQKTVEETVSRDLKQIALHATGEVLKEYEGAYRALDATASILGTLHADPWRQETAVVELSLKYPSLRHICSSNLKGHPIACSDLGESNSNPIKPEILECIYGPGQCISEVRIAPDYIPVMDIAVPIRRYGKIEGILTAEYNLRGVWEVVDQIKFGPQSRAILVDQFGHILAHPDKKEVLKNHRFKYPDVIKDLELGKNETRFLLNSQHQKWVVAYSPINSLHWGLIVAQPYKEAFAFVRVMDTHSWILVVFSVFAAVLIGFIIAQWMSRPMREMINATRRLAHGDLSVSLPIRRRDEISRLKFAFNHMTVQLKKAREVERLSIVGKSAASIAHELKNSLVLVKTFVQMIPHRHKEKAFVQEATETINRELENWNAMLRNMMDFAREQMPLQLKDINLSTLIEEASLLIKLRAEHHHIAFDVRTTNEVLLTRGDEGKIKQVVINLITNAFESAQDGGAVSIRTFSTEESNKSQWVGFEVTNTGEGISPEHMLKIFDPFFSTKETGLGLGLAISKDIIQRHGGRLEASSKKGQGAIFRVYLPVYVSEPLERSIRDFRENRRSG